MSQAEDVPKPLQADTVEAKLVREKIWSRMWRHNEHFMAVVVGREGSGKSHTAIKFSEVADPTFNADRVMFDPAAFLRNLRTWKEENETKGKMVVIDEAGVGVGVRTWHDKAQIRLNQVLQIIRDENMGVIFTLPRLEELDSQTRGRLHAFIEMTEKNEGNWVKAKWLEMDPTVDGRNKIYREYPSHQVNGVSQPIKRLCLSPPDPDIIKAYDERKNKFQAEQYADALEEMEDEVDDEQSVKEIAVEIGEGSLEEFVSSHSQNGTAYIDKSLLRAEYGLSHADTNAVKSLLEKKFGSDELDQYV